MISEHAAALVSTGIDLAGIAALVVGAALAFLLAGKTLVGTKRMRLQRTVVSAAVWERPSWWGWSY